MWVYCKVCSEFRALALMRLKIWLGWGLESHWHPESNVKRHKKLNMIINALCRKSEVWGYWLRGGSSGFLLIPPNLDSGVWCTYHRGHEQSKSPGLVCVLAGPKERGQTSSILLSRQTSQCSKQGLGNWNDPSLLCLRGEARGWPLSLPWTYE